MAEQSEQAAVNMVDEKKGRKDTASRQRGRWAAAGEVRQGDMMRQEG
jgi:hypothetical protein